MFQVLTVSCKIEVSSQQVEKLDAVLRAFASCCEYVNKNTDPKLTNQIALQSLIYKEVREYSGLSAQMTIHAMRRVCANRKTAKQQNRPVKGFAPTRATDDARTFTFTEKDWKVSLTMLKGREKFSLHIGNYQRHLLTGINPKSAVLVKRKDCSYYLQIPWKSEPPQPEKMSKVLGIDLGDCGWIGDADENGAKNISILGLLLDQPGGSGLACSQEEHVLGLLKFPCSA